MIDAYPLVVCDTAKVRFFKQITTRPCRCLAACVLFAILQKYDFSSKSQHIASKSPIIGSCLRYCKSTIFQANHNITIPVMVLFVVVCDTAKVRFFKQITTECSAGKAVSRLFAILQKYDFSSKSQHFLLTLRQVCRCLRYCKSTIFQANHNNLMVTLTYNKLFAILQKYDFSSKSQQHRHKWQ